MWIYNCFSKNKVNMKDTLKAIEQLEFSYTAGESVKQFNCSE